jgi:hypothetical protein
MAAKPINYEITLESQDLSDFEEYNKNPTCTDAGLLLLKEAEKLAASWEKTNFPKYPHQHFQLRY